MMMKRHTLHVLLSHYKYSYLFNSDIYKLNVGKSNNCSSCSCCFVVVVVEVDRENR